MRQETRVWGDQAYGGQTEGIKECAPQAQDRRQDQALRLFNTAYQERDRGLVGLKTHFLLDTLCSEPRFAELVRKVGLLGQPARTLLELWKDVEPPSPLKASQDRVGGSCETWWRSFNHGRSVFQM